MLIRPFEPRDLGAWRVLVQQIIDEGTTFAYTDLAAFEQSWLGPGCTLRVAEEEGRLLGSYGIKANFPGRSDHVANAFYAVSERARGRQVGQRMGQHSLDLARQLGFLSMQFNLVVSTNTGAVHLWESLGFATVGRLPGAFRHPQLGRVDALVMFREL